MLRWLIPLAMLWQAASAAEWTLPVPGQADFVLSNEHPLSEWIDLRLNAAEDSDVARLADQLNHDFLQIRSDCAGQNSKRKASCLEIEEINPNVLAAAVSLDTECGIKRQLFLYRKTSGSARRWQRFWRFPENEFAEPLTSLADSPIEVEVTDGVGYGRGGLIVVTGDLNHCGSNWEYGEYRIWYIDPTLSNPQLVLHEGRDTTIDGPLGIEANTAKDTARIQWNDDSPIAAYEVKGNKISRLQPIARDPIGFVLEWLRGSWADILSWPIETDRHARFPLTHEWMRKERLGQPGFGDGIHPYRAARCKKTPGLWQVTIQSSWGDDQPVGLFLIRQRGKQAFDLVDIIEKPRPDCVGAELGHFSFYPYRN